MDIVSLKLIEEVIDRFYIVYMDRDQYRSIPSIQGLKFYEEIMKRPSDYMVFYMKDQFTYLNKEFDEDDEGFVVTEPVEIYPEFYTKDKPELEDLV